MREIQDTKVCIQCIYIYTSYKLVTFSYVRALIRFSRQYCFLTIHKIHKFLGIIDQGITYVYIYKIFIQSKTIFQTSIPICLDLKADLKHNKLDHNSITRPDEFKRRHIYKVHPRQPLETKKLRNELPIRIKIPPDAHTKRTRRYCYLTQEKKKRETQVLPIVAHNPVSVVRISITKRTSQHMTFCRDNYLELTTPFVE